MADTNLIYPYTFEGGKKAVASEVNANFDAVKLFANGINATLSDIQNAVAELKKKPTREMFDIYFSITGETPAGAYPLWTGETITNCKVLYPQFWKKLLELISKGKVPTVESDNAYNEKVEEYGQCPAFYVDELNGHVRLPKITRFISSISSISDLGKVYNDQVSSHKHAVGNVPILNTSNPNSWLFHRDGARVRTTGTTNTETTGAEGFPKHAQLCLYIQVVNNFAELSELDVDSLKNELETYITRLEDDYNSYLTGLQAEYDSIKEDIKTASRTYKYTNVQVGAYKFDADSTYPEYPFKADIEISEADSDMIATVIFSTTDAESGNYAPVSETSDGVVTIYSKAIPEVALVIPTILVQ